MTPISVLLVDDEHDFIDSLAERLRRRDIAVACSYSGRDALRRLGKDNAIDIVIVDMGMPYPDGLAVLATIRQKYPLIEVIMLTGDATVHSAVAAIKLGAFDYLLKPCAIEDLLAKTELAQARRQQRQEKILDVRMKPFISAQDRAELIAKILAD